MNPEKGLLGTKVNLNKKRLISLAIIFIVVILAFWMIPYLIFFGDSPHVAREKGFIRSLSRGDDSSSTYLSARLKSEISKRCPHTSLHESLKKCTENLIPSDWGILKEIAFTYGKPRINATIYITWWSNLDTPIVVVVIGKEENGNWVIDGWRGFVPFQGEDEDSKLLIGTRHDNEFP